MRFSVPALRVGVLEYGAGQLQTGNAALEGKAVRLYYPPEAVSDEKFLKSLKGVSCQEKGLSSDHVLQTRP